MLWCFPFVFSYYRLHEEHYMYYPTFRPESRDKIKYEIREMEEKVEALVRKLVLEEVAIDVSEERCNITDRNLR